MKKTGHRSVFQAISYIINGHSLPGQELEQRLFTSVLFLCSIASLVAFVENYFLNFHLYLQIGTLVAALLFLLFWLLARRGISYLKLVYPAIYTIMFTLSLVWIFNDGSRGGSQLFMLLCPLVFIVFSRGAGRIITIGTYLIIMAFLYLLEHTNPEVIIGYSSETDRFVDVSISFFMTTLLATTFVLVLHNGYRRAIEKADNEKRASEIRFFETADMLPVGICETGPDLFVSFINREGYELTGYDQSEIESSGHTLLDLLHPDDREKAQKHFSATLSGSYLPLSEYRIVAKEGKIKKVLLKCGHINSEDPGAGLRICMIDVTEEKSLEDRYRQSQKMESVGLLAGGVAHDFNNILSAIVGYASLMRIENRQKGKDGQDSNIEEQATAILNASERATDLVRKLLEFSRQGAYEVKPVNMHTVIDDVVTLLAHSIDKRITIAKSLTSLNPVIDGDQSLLQSALLNLAVNARDAMPEGGTLTFSTKCVTYDSPFETRDNILVAPGSYVAVTVADTGTGMSDEAKEHIFEPFFTTKEPGKGTGLGLASVFGTVTRHNGFIDVQSEKGKGTSITFNLPQAAAEQPGDSEDGVKREQGRRSFHVLVVDDESMICRFVERILEVEGHKTTSFTKPAQAVEWYEKNYSGVDCILLDMNMPVMDGKTCFKAMRRIHPEAKAVFFTGFKVKDTGSITRMPGIKAYIQKPFKMEELVEAIELAVDGRSIL